MAGMKRVMVLEPGRYNDGEGKARELAAGEVLETHAWYAEGLVEAGLATWLVEEESPKSDVQRPKLEEERSDFEDAVPADVVESLRAWGIKTVEDLWERTDEELMRVPGVGKGRLRKLREMGGEK